MQSFEVTFQLVGSPINQCKSAGTINADGLIEAFRKYPFEAEVDKAESKGGGATLPTITFKRQSDGQEIAVWTQDAKRFDLCLIHEGKKSFVNNQSMEQVEAILTRFQREFVTDIRPKSFWRRCFNWSTA